MAIEINGLAGHNTVNDSAEGARARAGRATTTATGQSTTAVAATADTVTLTDTATRLQSLHQTLSQLPEVEAPRVQAVQRAVDSGAYQIDPARIATRMLALESMLAPKP